MQKMTHAALEPFQREHQDVLLFCERVRLGLRAGVSYDRIRKYALWLLNHVLEPHFREEEQNLFPLLGPNLRVRKALANHRRIRRILACDCTDEKVLNLLEEELTTYIGFEERVLFKQLAGIDPLKFKQTAFVRNEAPHLTYTQDRFWETDKP